MSLPVTSGLVLDLNAATLAATLNNGDPVALWPDDSGSGNDAAQPTSGNQPVLRKSGNLAYVRFDGSNDYMEHGYLGEPRTIFAVATTFVPDAFRSILGARSNTTGSGDDDAYYFQTTTAGPGAWRFMRATSNTDRAAQGGQPFSGSWALLGGTYDGTTVTMRHNGAPVESGYTRYLQFSRLSADGVVGAPWRAPIHG